MKLLDDVLPVFLAGLVLGAILGVSVLITVSSYLPFVVLQ